MTTSQPLLSRAAARRYVSRNASGTHATGRVGAEVEWILRRGDDLLGMIDIASVMQRAGSTTLPSGATRVTFEPGGQLELSSDPMPSAEHACDAIAHDLAVMRARLSDHELLGMGTEPIRPHQRVRTTARYDAMEAFFDRFGPHGRIMMCRTASIQVNLDAGADLERRWQRAHHFGPLLVAMFANSPLFDGEQTGWRSTRMANWWAMDATRTHPALRTGGVDDWVDYALAANVMLIRDGLRWQPIEPGLSFATWIEDSIDGRFPDEDDLAYHLTTLFPPVRLRGWLELRMIDALPDPWWAVAVLVASSMLDNDVVAAVADEVCAPIADAWMPAARDGLSSRRFATAARAVFDAVLAATAPSPWRDSIAAYAETYVVLGRTPADDVLDDATLQLKEAASR